MVLIKRKRKTVYSDEEEKLRIRLLKHGYENRKYEIEYFIPKVKARMRKTATQKEEILAEIVMNKISELIKSGEIQISINKDFINEWRREKGFRFYLY